MTDDLKHLADEVSASGTNQTRAAAKLMSRVADNPESVPQLLAYLHNAPQPRLILGITGPPGVGKSTFTDAFIAEFRRRHRDRRLGIIAVDPSSPTTGGAILGDRIRMMRHASDPNVFIRSLASRGTLGGLTNGITGTIRVMGALHCDLVIVETVGVGQTEVEVREVTDLVAIILAPGFGDEIQLLKAGLLEIGDLFILNKSDLPGATELQTALESTLHMSEPRANSTGVPAARAAQSEQGKMNSEIPRIFPSIATDGTGIPTILDALDHLADLHHPQWLQRRSDRAVNALKHALLVTASQHLKSALESNGLMTDQLHQVLQGQQSIDAAVRELLTQVASQFPKLRSRE